MAMVYTGVVQRTAGWARVPLKTTNFMDND
jgi:hypothetical protein